MNLTASNGTLIYENVLMENTTIRPDTTGWIFEKNYTLQGGDPPGEWIINVTANDTYDNRDSNSTTFTVNVWVDIVPSQALYPYGIRFGNVDPGTNDNEALNNSDAPNGGTNYNITIDPTTNVNVDLYHASTGDFGNIGIGNVTHQANTTSNTGTNLVPVGSISLSTTYGIIGDTECQNLPQESNCWIRYWLDVPAISPGVKSTTYKICGVENGAGSGNCA